jgi:NADH-quinone oxidoreductase subunit M
MILGAAYLFWMLRKVVFGPLREPSTHGHARTHEETTAVGHHEEVRPVAWYEVAGLAPLMVLIVLIGLMPGPFLARIRPAVATIDRNLQAQRGTRAAMIAASPPTPVQMKSSATLESMLGPRRTSQGTSRP